MVHDMYILMDTIAEIIRPRILEQGNQTFHILVKSSRHKKRFIQVILQKTQLSCSLYKLFDEKPHYLKITKGTKLPEERPKTM
jgi:hypothetical protein